MAGIMDRIRALLAQQQGGPMPNMPAPPVGMPGMMAPPPQPMDTINNPALAAGMAQGAMGGPPPMGPGRSMPSAMDGSLMAGKDHLSPLEAPDDAGDGLGMGDLLGIGKADAAELGQGIAAGRDLLNTPRATHATPVPVPRPNRAPIPMPAIRPRVPVPSSRPDVMPHQAPGYGAASGYDPSAAYALPVTPQSRVVGNGGPPQALFPGMGGGMAHGGTTGMPATGGTTGQPPASGGGPSPYLMDYIARMMARR